MQLDLMTVNSGRVSDTAKFPFSLDFANRRDFVEPNFHYWRWIAVEGKLLLH
jgi:hypothetical protein